MMFLLALIAEAARPITFRVFAKNTLSMDHFTQKCQLSSFLLAFHDTPVVQESQTPMRPSLQVHFNLSMGTH